MDQTTYEEAKYNRAEVERITDILKVIESFIECADDEKDIEFDVSAIVCDRHGIYTKDEEKLCILDCSDMTLFLKALHEERRRLIETFEAL